MIRTKKIAILAIIAMVFTLMPAALFAATDNRLAGADRISTALAIATEGWATASTVVLAPADQANLVDALAAAPLAGKTSPILLTFKSALNDDVKAKITALGATKVYAIGAISDAVIAEVEAMAGVTVEKLSGANRWATADAVNAKLTSPAGTFVVGYNAIADALSVASYAAANNYAIVLTKADGTVDASKLVGSKTYLVGGTAVVKDYAGATRLGGADRFATNAAVASGLTFSYGTLYVANGLTMVDALSAASLAAKTNSFVALASASSVAANVTSGNVIALGGTAAVTEAVRASVDTSANTVAVVSVSAINRNQIEVKFNKDLDKVSAENEANYTINGTVVTDNGSLFGGAGTVAKLQSDKKTVILTAANNALANDVSATIKVENVTDTSYNKIAKYTGVVTGNDKVAPSIVAVTASAGTEGTKKVTVEFSEPVVSGAFNIDNVSATATYLDKYKKKVELVAGQSLVAGTSYTLTVTSISDGANAAATLSSSFTVANGTGSLGLVSVAQKNSYIALTFANEIDAAKLTDRTINSSATSDDIVVAKLGVGTQFATALQLDPEDSDKKTVLVTVDSSVYGTKDSVEVTFKAKKIVDVYGNVMDSLTKTITLSKDLTAPTLVGAKLVTSNNQDIILEFSEPVTDTGFADDMTVVKTTDATSKTTTYTNDGAGGADATEVISKSDGSTVDSGVTSSKYVKVTLITALGEGDYTFTIPANQFRDVSANYQKSATSFGVSVSKASDTTKPIVSKGTSPAIDFSGGKNEITIGFDEKVQLADVQNLSNYVLNGKTLPVGTEVLNISTDPKDYNKFKLVLPANGWDSDAAVATLTVSNIRDTAGNALNTTVLSDFNAAAQDLADTKKPTLVSVEATADDKLVLVFSEPVAPNDGSGGVGADITVGTWTIDWNGAGDTLTPFTIVGEKVTITKAGLGANDYDSAYFTMVAGAFKDLATTPNNISAKTADDRIAITDKFVDVTSASVATTDNGGVADTDNISEIAVNITANANVAKDEVIRYDIYIAKAASATIYTKVSDVEANLTKLASFAPVKAGSAQALDVSAGTKLSDGSSVASLNETVITYIVAVDEKGNKGLIKQNASAAAINIAD